MDPSEVERLLSEALSSLDHAGRQGPGSPQGVSLRQAEVMNAKLCLWRASRAKECHICAADIRLLYLLLEPDCDLDQMGGLIRSMLILERYSQSLGGVENTRSAARMMRELQGLRLFALFSWLASLPPFSQVLHWLLRGAAASQRRRGT